MKKFLLFLIFLIASPPYLHAQTLSSLAETLFKKYSPVIYQVESISTQSNKKNSVGSGFQISNEGYIVTNYHVVSDAVMFSWAFQMKVIQPDGKEQTAEVIDFDIIHDLAIIKIKQPSSDIVLPLGSSDFNKGKKIFAIGNPLDLGMTIIEGLSNGYLDKAIYKKMLTTLSLNHGMSGGPTIDEEGNVVGINVATTGNAISFLVPVEFLKILWQNIQSRESKSYHPSVDQVEKQLIQQEEIYIKPIIHSPWERQHFGKFFVPTTISKEFTCWGRPSQEKNWLIMPYLDCELQDDLYVSSNVRGHVILFNYSWIQSQSNDPLRFYYLTQNYVNKGYQFDLNKTYERDVENFKCRTDNVNINNQPFWVSSCARQLKQLKKLYDINIRMASLGEGQQMLVVELTLSTITQDSAKAFINKFYRELWHE